MAFPTTSVLTNFTGADEDPLSEGGNWSGPVESGQNRLKRVSNQVSMTTGLSTSYWTPGTFGPDAEAFLQSVGTLPVAGKEVQVYARISSPNDAVNAKAYLFQWRNGTGFEVYRLTGGGTYTKIGSTDTGHTLAAGEGIGMMVSGNGGTVTITGYYRTTGGVWTQLGTTWTDTDPTRITAAGYIGVGMADTLSRADDFGGGTVVSGGGSPSLGDTGATITESLVRKVTRVLADTGASVTESLRKSFVRAVSDTGASISESVASSAVTGSSPPSYHSAGAGAYVSSGSNTIAPTRPSTIGLGDLLVLHILELNLGNDFETPTTPAGWSPTFPNDWLDTDGAQGRSWVFLKVANSTDVANAGTTLTVTFSSNTNRRLARMYAFSGAAGSVEGGQPYGDNGQEVFHADLTTSGGNRLGIALVAGRDGVGVSAFTGDSGGTFSEPVSEFNGAVGVGAQGGTLQLQVVSLPSAATVSGGLFDADANLGPYSVRTFALVPGSRTFNASDTGASISDRVARSVKRVKTDTGATVSDSIFAAKSKGRFVTDTGVTSSASVIVRKVTPIIVADRGALITEVLSRPRTRTLSDTGATISDSIASNVGTRTANDSYADGAAQTFGAVTGSSNLRYAMFADAFVDFVPAVGEATPYYCRLPFVEAQKKLGETGVETGTAALVNCSWHGEVVDPDLGSFVLVRADSELFDRIGRRVRITRRGQGGGGSVVGYVHGIADLEDADDISLPRRLFLALAPLGDDRAPVLVETLKARS